MSQVLGAILAIRVQVTGANSVTATLNRVKQAVGDAGKQVKDTTDDLKDSAVAAKAWGLALLSAGLGIGKEAVSAYEGVEKTRRAFVALIGESRGNAFAEWFQQFDLGTTANTEALRKAASVYLTATKDVQGAKGLLGGLDNLAAIGKTNVELRRTAEIVANIQTSAKFGKGDYNRLQRNEAPLQDIAAQLGVKNLRDAIGNKTGAEVAAATIKALNGLDKGTPLLLQRGANAVKELRQALVPTGRLIELVMMPLVWTGTQVIRIFGFINKATFGFAGALLSVGVASAGVAKLLPILKEAWALTRLIFSVEAIQGFFAFFPKIIGALRTILSIETLLTVIEGVRAAIATAWAFAMGNPGAVIAAAILAAVGIGYASGAFGGGGGKDNAQASNSDASRGGGKRSSFDNFMYGQFGRLTGG